MDEAHSGLRQAAYPQCSAPRSRAWQRLLGDVAGSIIACRTLAQNSWLPATQPIGQAGLRTSNGKKFLALIDSACAMSKLADEPFEIHPLTPDEGGGFLISEPDFSECISDGKTIEDALKNGPAALEATIATLKAKAVQVPAPNSGGVASGKFVARVSKTIHAQLTSRAKVAGVSLNTLVVTFSAQGLGRKEGQA